MFKYVAAQVVEEYADLTAFKVGPVFPVALAVVKVWFEKAYIKVGIEIVEELTETLFESVAENTKDKVPVDPVIPEAVPLISPEEDKVIPVGNVPETNEYAGPDPESSVATS